MIRPLLLILAAVALLAWLVPGAARSHDYWISKNPETQWCCSRDDCRMLGEGEAVQTSGGWQVNGHPIAAKYVYPVTSSEPAEATRFHACFYADGSPRCLFIPALF